MFPFCEPSFGPTHGPLEKHAHFCVSLMQDPERFESRMGSPGDFWNKLHGPVSDAVRDFPKDNCWAIGFHGDGASTSKTRSLVTFAWNSLHAVGSTEATRNVFTADPKEIFTYSAMQQVAKQFVWETDALAQGVMPHVDSHENVHPEAGRALCGGRRFLFIQVRADWEFLGDFFKLQRWDNANCCWLCNATLAEGECCFTRAYAGAGWRRGVRSSGNIRRELRCAGHSPEMLKSRTLVALGIMVDVLHCCDQGVALHV